MSRYLTSKMRLTLPAIALVGAGLIARHAFAQAEAEEAPAVADNVYSLVFQNLEIISISILLLSVVAVTLIIQNFIRVRKSVLIPEQSTEQMREMIANRQFKELIDYTENDPTFVAQALNPALKRAPRFAEMKEAMETAVAEQAAEQFRKLEYLNILANVGPLLGLLGTVVGIMQAFLDMQKGGGSASPADLAQGISVALGTTMLGLILAIPCLSAYGYLRNKVDRLVTIGALEAEELLLMIRPSDSPAKPSAKGGTSRPAVAKKPAAPTPPTPQVAVPQSQQ